MPEKISVVYLEPYERLCDKCLKRFKQAAPDINFLTAGSMAEIATFIRDFGSEIKLIISEWVFPIDPGSELEFEAGRYLGERLRTHPNPDVPAIPVIICTSQSRDLHEFPDNLFHNLLWVKKGDFPESFEQIIERLKQL